LRHSAAQDFELLDGAGPNAEAGVWLLHSLRAHIQANNAEQVQAACAQIEAAAQQSHSVLLLDYELGYWLEPAAAIAAPRIERAPLEAFVFEQAQWLARADFDAQLQTWVATLPGEQAHAGIAELRFGLDGDAYRHAIERILAYIYSGDTYQVNFTWPMHFQCYGHPLALYAALRARQPVEHGAYIACGDRHVLSLSPELFLQRHGTRLTSKPMKGTAPRGSDETEDRALAEALHCSLKNRAENVMIVDLIRNDLGRLAKPGSVKVESLFSIEKYPTVHQMVSTVSADVGGASLYAILRALFPCGSITGAPKIRAMQIAQELESGPRGLYTGSIAHLQPDGDFSFSVAIRTLELDAQARGRLGIGGGIVADSQPEHEYRECLDKARFLTALPAGFELIETLLLSAGEARSFPLLARHLARLRGSAAYFGFAYSETAVVDALQQYARRADGKRPHRVRLTLAKSGTPTITMAPLVDFKQAPAVAFSTAITDSTSLFLRHKTTVRPLYERSLRSLPEGSDIFDLLFFNERGELTEGARSNVYLVRNGRWFTPPLSCGALGGVMRADVLARAEPEVEERVLYREDVLQADEIYLSNALRGLFRVHLVGTPTQSS
jgi:para-aminobenzoate synthetase/4-amino-4-deoxychorismate lyase